MRFSIARLTVGDDVIETDLKLCKISAKTIVDSQKFTAKRAFLNLSSILILIYLGLAAQDPQKIEKIPDLVLFVDRFAQIVANVSISKIDSLSRLNTRLISKWAAY